MTKSGGDFEGKASIYAKYRAHYSEYYKWMLINEIGISSSSVIADLGAGTGLHTKLLAEFSHHVTAVEPDSEMLAECRSYLGELTNVSFINASAESLPLDSRSFDYVTVAQAFHLFNCNLSLHEIFRVLNYAGQLILTWNSKEKNSLLFEKNEKILEDLCPAYKRNVHAIDFTPTTYQDCFTPSTYKYYHGKHDNNELLDKDTFVYRTLSASYAPSPNDAAYDKLACKLEGLFNKFCHSGKILIEQSTVVYAGEVRIPE